MFSLSGCMPSEGVVEWGMAGRPKGKLPKTAKRKKEKRAATATDGEMAYGVIIAGGSFKVELRSKERWTVREAAEALMKTDGEEPNQLATTKQLNRRR